MVYVRRLLLLLLLLPPHASFLNFKYTATTTIATILLSTYHLIHEISVDTVITPIPLTSNIKMSTARADCIAKHDSTNNSGKRKSKHRVAVFNK